MTTSISVEELIQRKLDEIDEGVGLLELERERLQRALRELQSRDGSDTRAASRAEGVGGQTSRPRRKPRGTSARRARAPRGSNQKAILEHISQNPGATTARISEGTGIDRTIVYSALARLTTAGKIRREPLTDGQVAYQAAGDVPT